MGTIKNAATTTENQFSNADFFVDLAALAISHGKKEKIIFAALRKIPIRR